MPSLLTRAARSRRVRGVVATETNITKIIKAVSDSSGIPKSLDVLEIDKKLVQVEQKLDAVEKQKSQLLSKHKELEAKLVEVAESDSKNVKLAAMLVGENEYAAGFILGAVIVSSMKKPQDLVVYINNMNALSITQMSDVLTEFLALPDDNAFLRQVHDINSKLHLTSGFLRSDVSWIEKLTKLANWLASKQSRKSKKLPYAISAKSKSLLEKIGGTKLEQAVELQEIHLEMENPAPKLIPMVEMKLNVPEVTGVLDTETGEVFAAPPPPPDGPPVLTVNPSIAVMVKKNSALAKKLQAASNNQVANPQDFLKLISENPFHAKRRAACAQKAGYVWDDDTKSCVPTKAATKIEITPELKEDLVKATNESAPVIAPAATPDGKFLGLINTETGDIGTVPDAPPFIDPNSAVIVLPKSNLSNKFAQAKKQKQPLKFKTKTQAADLQEYLAKNRISAVRAKKLACDKKASDDQPGGWRWSEEDEQCYSAAEWQRIEERRAKLANYVPVAAKSLTAEEERENEKLKADALATLEKLRNSLQHQRIHIANEEDDEHQQINDEEIERRPKRIKNKTKKR